MIEKITKNISRLFFPNVHTCNSYIIHDKKILIDLGIESVFEEFENNLAFPISKIKYVFFTHLHYDHIDMFNKIDSSKIYISKNSMDCLKNKTNESILSQNTIDKINKTNPEFNVITDEVLLKLGFELFDTPGHAEGSISLLYDDNGTKILFSGDLFFNKDMTIVGRTDLPTSSEIELKKSLRKISEISYDILCPGHGRITKLK